MSVMCGMPPSLTGILRGRYDSRKVAFSAGKKRVFGGYPGNCGLPPKEAPGGAKTAFVDIGAIGADCVDSAFGNTRADELEVAAGLRVEVWWEVCSPSLLLLLMIPFP